jgi:hypothetical protein
MNNFAIVNYKINVNKSNNNMYREEEKWRKERE